MNSLTTVSVMVRNGMLMLIAIAAGLMLGSSAANAYEEDWSPARKWDDLSVTWYIHSNVDDLVTSGKREASGEPTSGALAL